jgi:uncharacterized protein YqhQ
MSEAAPVETVEEAPEAFSPQEVAQLSGAREETPIYGGQALMEGVMMRSPRFVAAAVRREDGEVVLKREALSAGSGLRGRVLKLPIVRGCVALWDALSMGMRYLSFSGEVLMEEAAEQESITFVEGEVELSDSGETAAVARHVATGLEVLSDRERTIEKNRQRAERILRGKVARAKAREQAVDPVDPPGAELAHGAKSKRGALSSVAMTAMMIVAFAIALVVFLWAPHALAYWFTGSVLGLWDPAQGRESIPTGANVALNLIEGVVRLAFFFLYVFAIGKLRDIRRVFEYHGAEHKVVHAVENEADLTVNAAQRFATIHPRCGTNFIAVAICVAIVLLSFIRADAPLLRFGLRVALLPVVAAVAYELLRLAGRCRRSAFMRAIIAPGALLQHLTTRQPDDSQVDIAVRAMKEVVALEARGGL